MKVVIDTNVLFSALYAPESVPDQILRLAVRERVLLHALESVRNEMLRVMEKKIGGEDIDRIVDGLPMNWVPAVEYHVFMPDALPAIRDESDAPLVAVAMMTGADIVSGDASFHPLLRPLVRTWTPRGLLEHLVGLQEQAHSAKKAPSSRMGSSTSRGLKSGGKARA